MDTFERLIKVFNAVFDGEIETSSLTLDSNLKDDIGINSIGMLYMAIALEEEFKIKFVNDDFIELITINDVIACIERKCAL